MPVYEDSAARHKLWLGAAWAFLPLYTAASLLLGVAFANKFVTVMMIGQLLRLPVHLTECVSGDGALVGWQP